jgi:hypothetical protein
VVAESTRPIALDAISSADTEGADVAMSAVLWRDWLVELSSLLDVACDATRQLASAGSDARSRTG